MNIKKKVLVAAIGATMGLSGAVSSVSAATLTSLVLTGGTFNMGVFTPPAGNPITNFSGANLIAGAIAPTFNTAISHTGAQAGSPMAWDFNGGGTWVNSFTTAASSGSTSGVNSISGTINITDNWNGTNFAQGGAFTGTTSGSNFTISWTSLIVGGPFNNQTGTYSATGTFAVAPAVVPVPAAAWLLGSGLIGLVGVARRNKAKA